MDVDRYGMDTITLAGSLQSKLAAMKAAGFTQVMLSARDLVDDPAGEAAAIAAVRASGLRVTGFQVLRDFEGLSGHLHAYKVDVAKSMLTMCHAVGSRVLLCCSSTSTHATDDRDHLVRDLQKLAMLAAPLGIRVAFEALSWGRHVNEYTQAWDIVQRADRSNLGLGIDSFHILATHSEFDLLDEIFPEKIFLVQLADFMWQELRSPEERINTARHFRVFPGEGVHSEQVTQLVRKLEEIGYAGDYSFEVFNDDYQQLPLPMVVGRAHDAVRWLVTHVSRGSLLPWTRRPTPAAMPPV